MPERLEGRAVLRRGAALTLAFGSAVLGTVQLEEEPSKVEALSASEAKSFFPLPVDVTYEETTTSAAPSTTTTEMPTTTTTVPQTTTTTTSPPPPPPPREISGAPAEWMTSAGIPTENHDEVDYIMTRESEWKPWAKNGKGCIGLGQNCPDKNGNYWLDDACPDWPNDPVCQLERFQVYAYDRYGGWDGAAAHSRTEGWW